MGGEHLIRMMSKAVTNNHQAGAVLFTGLITLVVLSLVAVSSMQGSTLEQRMAGNINDHMLAFEAAEAALFEAELLIQGDTLTLADFQSGNSDGLYDDDATNIWLGMQNGTVIARPSVTYVPGGTNHIATAPTFVIQYLGETTTDKTGEDTSAPIIELYRITSRGTGKSNNSVVMLESTYGFSDSTNASVTAFLGRQSWRQIEF